MKRIFTFLPGIVLTIALSAQPPLADGQSKFLGCAHNTSQVTNFAKYWNQVTPENGGKWGTAEGTRDVMNWTQLDAAYNFAVNNGFSFKNHTMIWGNQQPAWIEVLDTAQQREEIEEWFQLTADRYPNMEFIDVVNEPLHAPPSGAGKGNYINALGGSGVTGWDWIIKSFKLARKYFPNSKLLINEYSVTNSAQATKDYLKIIRLLMADSLIDGIGIQAHAFSTAGIPATTTKTNLDSLANPGLPIYISELDIDGLADLTQLKEYQRVFPIFWEHPAVAGITLWGFRYGLWRTDQGAYLVNQNGTERTAFKWLKAYVTDNLVLSDSVSVTSERDTIYTGESLQFVAAVFPDTATIKSVNWSVNNTNLGLIGTNGILNSEAAGKITITARTWDNGITGTKEITIINRLVDSVLVSSAEDKDSINIDETLAFQASVYPENATNTAVGWKVIPSGLATITTTGVLTALAEGVVTVIATAKDGSAAADSFEVTLVSPTALSSSWNELKASIYPNPAVGGKFTIEAPDIVSEISIMDLYGRTIRHYNKSAAPIRVDMSGLTGVYVIRFSDGKKSLSRKIILE
jgi:endo-1,4-beta-xylanase